MNAITSTNFEAYLVELIFAMLRIGAAFMIAPVFSALGLPLMVRIALAGAIGVLVIGMTDIRIPADPISAEGLAIAAQEVVLGLAMGFVLQIAFAGPLVAGDYIANSMGLGFASMVDPQGGMSSPVLAQFLMIFTTLVFLASDGHLALIEALVLSYETLPMSGAWLSPGLFVHVVSFGGIMFEVGLMIALPVGFALFLVNLIIGFMTRSAPQLNIFAVGIPVTLMVGFALMALIFPAMAELVGDVIGMGLENVDAIAVGDF